MTESTKGLKLIIWEGKRDKLRRQVAALRGKLHVAEAELAQAEQAVATLQERAKVVQPNV